MSAGNVIVKCDRDSDKHHVIQHEIASGDRDILRGQHHLQEMISSSTDSIKDSAQNMGLSIKGSVERNLASSERTSGEIKQTTERSGAEIKSVVKDGLHSLTRYTGQLEKELVDQFKTNHIENLKQFSQVQRQEADNTSAILLNQVKYHAELHKDLVDRTHDIKLDAHMNKESLSKQVSDSVSCLASKHDQTQSLIRDMEMQRLRDQVSDSKQENLLRRLDDRNDRCGRNRCDDRPQLSMFPPWGAYPWGFPGHHGHHHHPNIAVSVPATSATISSGGVSATTPATGATLSAPSFKSC
jgi:hypothetical protein